jgi:dihydroorotase (multifunctional complex type)
MTSRPRAMDLAIEGGTIIAPDGRRRATLYVADGRVAAISEERLDATRTVDASGRFLMPGMVDAHVHLMEPGQPEREDFPTGTAAAAQAGVTTLIEHTHGSPVRTLADLVTKVDRLASRSRVDFGLAAHSWPGFEESVEPLWRAGVAFFKVFTCPTHGVPGHSPAQLLSLFTELARLEAIALVHCEDASMTAAAEETLRAAGRADGGILAEWRTPEAELVAVGSVALLARLTGARVVVAHASHLASVELVEREQTLGAAVACETCPQYLALYASEALELGAFRKFTPPARARLVSELDQMFSALRDRRIAYVSTDHAPSTRADKSAGGIWDVHFGLPGLDTTLPFLLDAAHAGRISYELITEVYARTPARLYGLTPTKGSLEVGADADFVLVDPELAWDVSDADIISKAGWSPFAGRRFVGRAVATYLRGVCIARDGLVMAEPGTGRFVPGPGLRSPDGAY